ncbi:EAL domain-containing protein [Bacillus salitolerans]|uniref:EAL domain-containing protein n=1 Tax=Bacillus salitolerans TaxID=1437434 RepID=A0ABW4LLA1_9BACI
MNTYSINITTINELEHFISQHNLQHEQVILTQVFTGQGDKELINALQKELNRVLPQTVLIGTTTDGEIHQGEISSGNIVVSFTVFHSTTLQAFSVEVDETSNSLEVGRQLSSALIKEDTKALLLFGCGTRLELDCILNGIDEKGSGVIIAGGLAGAILPSDNMFVFTNDRLLESGIVCVSLSSEHLHAHSSVNYSVQKVGRAFVVSKANHERIYRINNKKPIRVLADYLGDEFVKNLPWSGPEFPFVSERNGEEILFFIKELHKDGSITVNRPVANGEQVHFAYVDLPNLIDQSIKKLKQLVKKPVETIFVYNCMTRRRYFNSVTETELRQLQKISSTTGFFGFGEISTSHGKRRLLGNAYTLLALSESHDKVASITVDFNYDIPEEIQSLIALSHLTYASTKDIEELHSSVEASEHRFRSLFEHNTDIVYSTDLRGNFTSVNPAFEKTLGFNKEEIINKHSLDYINEEDIPRVRMHFYRALKGKEQYYNIDIPTKAGEKITFQIKNIPIIINSEKVGIFGIGRNISEQRKAEEQITNLAYYDHDTGLPNRLLFTEKLSDMFERVTKKKKKLAVMFIDMDRFKIINDSLGHYAGDEILKMIADRIKKVLPSGSFLGRFAGDKFTLLLSKSVDIENIVNIAQDIQQCIGKPVLYLEQEYFITASIGISLYPDDGMDEQTILRNADAAMNRAKQQGGNKIKFYSTEMNNQALYRLELESYLRKALEKKEFFLCYQPLVDLETGTIYGSEALIRWNHPKLGLVSPVEFIPLAEETGLIHDIGRWVLFTACKQTKLWHDMGLGLLTVSVNVSANQFQQSHFLTEVMKALHDSGLPAEYLNLELTESVMLRNATHSIQLMKELQKIGVRVSIDDFGTGYSSLSYLKNLPINTLKIDRSFIQNLRMDNSDIAIVKAIITMGHGLDVKVVAEGVETEDQINLLKQMNCHYAQGYFIHRPLSIGEFEAGLKTLHIT